MTETLPECSSSVMVHGTHTLLILTCIIRWAYTLHANIAQQQTQIHSGARPATIRSEESSGFAAISLSLSPSLPPSLPALLVNYSQYMYPNTIIPTYPEDRSTNTQIHVKY